MPGMLGTTFAQSIRKLDSNIPIILASGNASIITEEELNLASPLILLSKPLQINELKEIISKTLDLKHAKHKKE